MIQLIILIILQPIQNKFFIFNRIILRLNKKLIILKSLKLFKNSNCHHKNSNENITLILVSQFEIIIIILPVLFYFILFIYHILVYIKRF